MCHSHVATFLLCFRGAGRAPQKPAQFEIFGLFHTKSHEEWLRQIVAFIKRQQVWKWGGIFYISWPFWLMVNTHTHIHTHTCGQMAEHGELCSTRICAKGYGHKWWAIRELHSAVWMKQVKWAQWTPVRATTEPQKFHWHSPNYKEATATGTLSGCHINVSELAWSKRYLNVKYSHPAPILG